MSSSRFDDKSQNARRPNEDQGAKNQFEISDDTLDRTEVPKVPEGFWDEPSEAK